MKRAIAILSVNIIVFCIVGEMVSLAVFYVQHGWLFYSYPYRETHELIPETAAQRLTGDALHPYFGPTHKPGLPFDVPDSLRGAQPARVTTNNFGFASPHDYPLARKSDRQFFIGLFGGSVGVWFCQVGTRRLIEDLQRNTYFKNRELVPLCLSHEGYKQPQQLLLLSYFLSIGQQFDLVINIDGFNEVALSGINDERGSDISMPSAVHLDPLVNLVNQSTLTPEKLDSLARINNDKQLLNSLAERIKASRLASVNLALEWYYSFIDRKYREELAAFDKLPSSPAGDSVIQVTPRLRVRQGTALFEDIARQWVTSSILMNELLAARSVSYFHFLQPNQYFTKRSFGPAEVKVALSDESPFKANAEKGYPFLVKAITSDGVKSSRLNLFDATGIFDREPSPVYLDNCCHYTLVGNEILADFIAMNVLNSNGPWK